ncbi:MAG: aldo/keto reductase [Oscillospiraceae bacterium]|nr:aldo/keto reductase [Oscillospiraceae bacterium]
MEKQITSRLGFGCMRLPVDENKEIDMEQFKAMVDCAMENGINYFDTAYGYHSEKSEGAVKTALVDRYPRERFLLADKLPLWIIESEEDVEKTFNTQLERTGAGYFDYYLLHAVNKDRVETIRKFNIVELLKKKLAEGKIKRLGFSFHDTAEVLEDFIGDYNWDFIQLQLNYYDMEREDYKQQYELVKSRNIPLAVMEPVRGGFLARTVPEAQKVIEAAYGENKSASLALSYVNSLEGVYIVLSGMSNMEQVKDNINTFANPIPMDEKAQQTIAEVLKEINAFKVVDCTKCEYCMPCPVGINIPKVFEIYNKYEMFKSEWIIKDYIKEAEVNPAECIGCGVCASSCPQAIAIPERIAEFNAIAEKLK